MSTAIVSRYKIGSLGHAVIDGRCVRAVFAGQGVGTLEAVPCRAPGLARDSHGPANPITVEGFHLEWECGPSSPTETFVTECQVCHQPLQVTIHRRAEYVCSPCFWKLHPARTDPLRELARKLLKWLGLKRAS